VAGGLSPRPGRTCSPCRTDRLRLLTAGAVSLGIHLLVLTLPAPGEGETPAREIRRMPPAMTVTLAPAAEPDSQRELSRLSGLSSGNPAETVLPPEPAKPRNPAAAAAPVLLREHVPEVPEEPEQEALPERLPVPPPYSLPGPSPAASSREASGANPLSGAAEVPRPAPPATGSPSPEPSGNADPQPSGTVSGGPAEVPGDAGSANPSGTVPFSSLVPRRTLPLPPYPEAARRLGYQGRVTLEFTVTPEGRVENLRTVEVEAPEILVEECLRTVRRWRFRPAGEAAVTRKTFVFLLEN